MHRHNPMKDVATILQTIAITKPACSPNPMSDAYEPALKGDVRALASNVLQSAIVEQCAKLA